MEVADLVYIDESGYHFEDYPAFLTFLQDGYKAIYGEDVYLESDSQDGQLLAVLALALYQTAAQGASTYASFSPLTAQGTGLSRNVKINGLKRHVPTNSSVDVDIIGQSGTVITNGVVQDTLDRKWNLPASVFIPISGTITVTATAQDEGALVALPNTVNRIFTPTLGWQSVTNPSAASPGAPIESDAELRLRQSKSTALPSLTVFDGTMGAVENVDGVLHSRGYENDTDVTDVNGIPPHTIAVFAEGGDATAIAQAIQIHKTPGTGTFGGVSETVYDSHGMPLIIKFSRPTQVTITVDITIIATPQFSPDYVDLIKQAVADYINTIGIGNDVQITRVVPPAYLLGTPAGLTYDVDSLLIGKNLDPVSNINIPIDFDELPICVAATDVTVTVT